MAGTRILAPRSRLPEILDRLRTTVAALKVGDSTDPSVNVRPMVSQKQWDPVQGGTLQFTCQHPRRHDRLQFWWGVASRR